MILPACAEMPLFPGAKLRFRWTIRYWDKARKEGIPVPADFGVFWEDVEWMALQRHLKVLGIFARLNYRDGKTKYLGDTPRFLNYVQKTASRLMP